jgi:hypothetical protein
MKTVVTSRSSASSPMKPLDKANFTVVGTNWPIKPITAGSSAKGQRRM